LPKKFAWSTSSRHRAASYLGVFGLTIIKYENSRESTISQLNPGTTNFQLLGGAKKKICSIPGALMAAWKTRQLAKTRQEPSIND
jgi:hypothetical protein